MLKKLTKREIEILRLVAIGYSNSDIAEILKITMHTVKAHVQAILCKLKVKNRVQAAVIIAQYPELQQEHPKA